jgi:hypothetical protein
MPTVRMASNKKRRATLRADRPVLGLFSVPLGYSAAVEKLRTFRDVLFRGKGRGVLKAIRV